LRRATELAPPQQWLALGTSTVSEAARVDCALDPVFRPAWAGAKVCGPALTVRCQQGSNLAVHMALELAEPGSVLVIAAHGHLAGYWGEVLTHAARAREITGIVIDGGVRDVEAMQEMSFPVFSTGVGMRGTSKAPGGTVGEQITVGGCVVETGSLVIGDSDGVLCLPQIEAEHTLAAARERQAQESAYFDRIAAGELTLDIYGWRVPGSDLPSGGAHRAASSHVPELKGT
jgi:4-hydroxy-4-methyl-2-oxoglutarate aldolase